MKCPNCGNEIPDEAKFCQHCGYKIEPTNTANGSQLEPSSNAAEKKKSGAGRIIFIIVIAAIGLFLFYSYNQYQARKRAYFNYLYNQREVEEQKRSDELKYYTQRNSDLLITNNGITSNSSYTICEGKITNKGKDSYKFIKIKGSFVDGNGNVVDTDWTYAIGGEGLSPGESTTWRLSVDKDTSIKDCKIIYTE